jgi:hypothetical protein
MTKPAKDKPRQFMGAILWFASEPVDETRFIKDMPAIADAVGKASNVTVYSIGGIEKDTGECHIIFKRHDVEP